MQARFPGEVPLLALHVGSRRDAGVPRAFLRGRRVEAEVRTLSPRAFRRLHGDAGVPSLHLVRGGRLVWTSALRLRPAEPRVRLDTLVARYRDGAPPAPDGGGDAEGASGPVPVSRRTK